MKNIQPIVDLNAYEFAGFPVQTDEGHVSHYYCRGLTHTTGHNPHYRTLDLNTGVWSAPVPIWIDTRNSSDVSGGKMDNNTIVLFYQRANTDGTRDIYIHKCDLNNNFSSPVLFDWTGVTKLTGGFFYGPMITGDVQGEYYHILYQTATSRYRTSIIKTTDYWNTYSEVGTIYDGTIPFSETAGINLGSGKFLALSRLNNSGTLIPFESVNYGATWLRKASSTLYWWNGGGPNIPWVYGYDGVFDIFYECRDTSMMHISKGNTLSNFGNTTPSYNPQEIYSYHRGTGTNPSLGYGSQIKLSDGRFLMIYSKEYTNARANLQWTIDDLVSDPSIPDAPVLTISGITATSFRFDITNYGDFQNVRYCLMDLSTTADFSSFVTCKYRTVSAYPAVMINNVRVVGYWDIFSGLTSATTYYFRIKGVNNLGESVYTTKQVTTL